MSTRSDYPGVWPGFQAIATAFVCLVSLIIQSGCVTHAAISDVNQPYNSVRAAVIKSLPLGLRTQSENQREMYSGYFDPKEWRDDASKNKTRAYAKVTILNSSRPYLIDIHVYTEVRDTDDGTYENDGEDEDMTDKLVEKIKQALAHRRDNGNVIDDFRAF